VTFFSETECIVAWYYWASLSRTEISTTTALKQQFHLKFNCLSVDPSSKGVQFGSSKVNLRSPNVKQLKKCRTSKVLIERRANQAPTAN